MASSTDKLDELLQKFMANNANNETAQRGLRRFLSYRGPMPEWQSPAPLLPTNESEIKIRLQHIQELENYWCKKFTRLTLKPMDQYRLFDELQVSALLQMDFNSLRHIVEEHQACNFEGTLSRLQVIPVALKIFATKDAQAAIRPKSLNRHSCLVTGTAHPEVCQILPFAANSTASKDVWEKCARALAGLHLVEKSPDEKTMDFEDRLRSLFSPELGVGDKHHRWNTILLTPTLHVWWRNGYFGLKYIGTKDAAPGGVAPGDDPDQTVTLRIQFHWMMWRERGIKGGPTTPLGRTVESIKAAFSDYCGDCNPSDGRPIVAIARPASGFNVETGDIFDVPIPKRHMEKMILAFKLQWALVKLLAMAGGPEALDYPLLDHPEFLDETWGFPGVTASWRQYRVIVKEFFGSCSCF